MRLVAATGWASSAAGPPATACALASASSRFRRCASSSAAFKRAIRSSLIAADWLPSADPPSPLTIKVPTRLAGRDARARAAHLVIAAAASGVAVQ
jgi:hypothetical protein